MLNDNSEALLTEGKLYNAEVILGNPLKKCSGHGICKVIALTQNTLDSCSCTYKVPSKLNISTDIVTVYLPRTVITPCVYNTHFKGGVVLVSMDIPIIGVEDQVVIGAGYYFVSIKPEFYVVQLYRLRRSNIQKTKFNHELEVSSY
jgi:hypothetical protein